MIFGKKKKKTTTTRLTENQYMKLLSEGKLDHTICWKCNPDNKHLKTSENIIACQICGEFYYKGRKVPLYK